MKELYEFANWASNLIYQPLLEKTERAIRREIPVSHDIQYQAQRKYPDRSPEQALSLYLADKLEDIEKINYEQNTVINAQRRENTKLNNNLSQLQQELRNIEDSSANADAEIDRLKALSGQLKGEVDMRRANSKEINELLDQVEQLKNKPGMSPDLYNELKQKIESAEGKNVNAEEFKKITNQVQELQSQQNLEKDDLTALKNTAVSLLARRDDISATREELSDVLDSIKTEKENLDQLLGDVTAEKEAAMRAKQEAEKALELVKNPKELVRQSKAFKDYAKAVQKRSKQASTLVKNVITNELPNIQNSIDNLAASDSNQDTQIRQIAQKIGTVVSPTTKTSSATDEPISDTDIAQARLGATSDTAAVKEPNDSSSDVSDVESFISRYTDDFEDEKENDPDKVNSNMSTNKNTKIVKENSNPSKIPEWASVLMSMIHESDAVQLERLLVIMKSYPEDVVMKTLLKDGYVLYQKYGEYIIGAEHLKIINDRIIKSAQKQGYSYLKFEPSNDPILYRVLKKYRSWINETQKIVNDIERLYQQEKNNRQATYQAYANREKVPGHMLGLDNNVAFSNTKFEESINKMLNDIIGEDVSHWIK